MDFHYCFTVYVLIEIENGKMLIGKHTAREVVKKLINDS